MNFLSRMERLVGEECVAKLSAAHIMVAGIGGVGGQLVESLARCGVGHLTLIDFDHIDITNINRQIHALHSTVGQKKVDVMKQRVLDINPNCICDAIDVKIKKSFHWSETPDYIADCVDDVGAKIALYAYANTQNIPLLSSMGTANRLDNGGFVITSIWKTTGCPLARAVRTRLRREHLDVDIKVCYNTTPSHCSSREVPATISYVPATAALVMANEIVHDILSPLNV